MARLHAEQPLVGPSVPNQRGTFLIRPRQLKERARPRASRGATPIGDIRAKLARDVSYPSRHKWARAKDTGRARAEASRGATPSQAIRSKPARDISHASKATKHAQGDVARAPRLRAGRPLVGPSVPNQHGTSLIRPRRLSTRGGSNARLRGLPAGPLLFGPSEPASPESETPYVKFYFGRHFSSVRSSRPRGQKFRARAALALGNLAPASVASGTSCPSGGACDALFAIRFRPGVLVLTPLRSSRGIRPCACKRCARAEFRMISPRGRTNPPACRRNPTEAPARRAYSKFF